MHYNGWGARWDEWLPSNSARLAPFRTFTVQNPRSLYLSPYPNITPDPPMGLASLDPQGAYPGDLTKDSLSKMMEEIHDLCLRTTDCIRGFTD